MALTACPDCGKDVSDAAPACIHCGRPSPAGTGPIPSVAAAPSVVVNAPTPQQAGAAGNVLAALVTFFVPGLGQLFQARVRAAFAFFVGSVVVWLFSLAVSLSVPQLLLAPMLIPLGWHLFAVVDAANWNGEDW